MDRRCLYGHRVNATFHYAIERDQCPICGAELITLDGYRLARQLAQSVPLEGSAAFRTVKLIETNYVLKPRPAPTAEARPAGPSPAEATTSASSTPTPQADPPPGTEITLEEEDLAHAAPRAAAPARPLAEEHEDDESVELIAAETTDEQERATRKAPAPPRAGGPRARAVPPPPTVPTAAPFTAEEDAFFATSP